MNWNVGDVVVLKSGGPKMTVVWQEDTKVCCQWYDGKKMQEDVFQAPMLEKPPAAGAPFVMNPRAIHRR